MNIFSITASLLMAGLALTPLAEAAPKGKKATTSKTTKKKPTPKPKQTQKPTPKPTPKPEPKKEEPKQEEPKPEEQKPAQEAGPENQQGDYTTFTAALDKQVKNNTYDACPALSIALKANNNDEVAVLDWMKRAAGEGNAAARHYTASIVLSSPRAKAGTPEVNAALADLKKSADQGFVPAKLDYSLFLNMGRGIQRDTKAAETMLMEACKGGDMQARFKWLLITDRVSKAEDLERPEVKSEIDRGNHYILFYMSYYFHGEKRMEMLMNAAKLGNSDAQYLLATTFLKTEPQRSFELLQEAVKLHNEHALFVMGSMMLEPDSKETKAFGIREDIETGLQLVKLAYLIGNRDAGAALGGIYYNGIYGVEKNRERAYNHYKEVAHRYNDANCAAVQGYMLAKGDGVAQDGKAGIELLEAAAKGNAANAPILLANVYYEGHGCEKDAQKALEYLQDAGYTGYAYLYMAYIYAKGGVNVPADADTADSYLRMAELDFGDKAKEMYDELIKAGKWEPHP